MSRKLRLEDDSKSKWTTKLQLFIYIMCFFKIQIRKKARRLCMQGLLWVNVNECIHVSVPRRLLVIVSMRKQGNKKRFIERCFLTINISTWAVEGPMRSAIMLNKMQLLFLQREFTQDRCHQWSTRPDPQLRQLRTLFSLEICFVLKSLKQWSLQTMTVGRPSGSLHHESRRIDGRLSDKAMRIIMIHSTSAQFNWQWRFVLFHLILRSVKIDITINPDYGVGLVDHSTVHVR